MKISIAMAAYNGAKYLREQLDSFAAQSRLPDELVVTDDGSTDETIAILEAFARSAPFEVRIFRNEANLGYASNFGRAIELCTGDLIFLSDQDDVWLPIKLEVLIKKFRDNPNMAFVFSDALVVDAQLHSLGYTMWERVSFTDRERRRFERAEQLAVLLKHSVVTGATMGVRAEIRDWVLPIPEHWVHDAWISMLVAAMGKSGGFIEEPLILYRQHAGQAIGGRKPSFKGEITQAISTTSDYYDVERSKLLQLLERASALGCLRESVKALIEAKIAHLEARRYIYDDRGPLNTLRIVSREAVKGRYHRFSGGWKSIAKDLSLSVFL